MNVRNLLVTACTVLTVASVGHPQVYSPYSVKSLATLLGGTITQDYIYDVKVDATGNRFVSGYTYDGANYHGFISKISKKGFVAWKIFDVDGSGWYPVSVAPDNLGHVYAVVPSGSDYYLESFDASTGAKNWSSAVTGFASYNAMVVVQPNGNPVTVSDSDIYGFYSGTIFAWDPNGAGWFQGYTYVNSASSYRNVTVDATGGIYAVGTAISPADSYTEGLVTYISPDFTAFSFQEMDFGGTDEYFNDVAVDPVTQSAVAVGTTYGTDTSLPIFGVVHIDWSSGSPVGTNMLYYTADYGYDAIGSSIAIDNNGNEFTGITRDVSTAPRAGAFATYMYDPVSIPLGIAFLWEQTVPATDTGTVDYAYGITTNSHGPILAVNSDLTIGTGSSAYQGIQTFSFNGTDGAPIDRKMYGTAAVAGKSTTAGYYYVNHPMSTVGGFLSIYTINDSFLGGVYTAQFKEGADDVYKVDEDTTLTVGLAKSVLNNDGNQFQFDPLTAQIIGSSVSAGIHSVTLNSNGTFTADFNPNFNGLAKFKYRVKQNGVFIKTNQVKINVKPKNDAPTAVNDSFNVAMNSAVQNLNVLGNDSDIDGDNITIFSKTNNANATIGITPDKKFITFKPKNGFSGDLTFTYTIRDTAGLQSTATVSVHVS